MVKIVCRSWKMILLSCGFHCNSVLCKPCISWKLEMLHELVMSVYVIPTLFFFARRTNEDDGVRNRWELPSIRQTSQPISSFPLNEPMKDMLFLACWQGRSLPGESGFMLGTVTSDWNVWCNFKMTIHDSRWRPLPLTSPQRLLPQDEKTLPSWQSVSGQSCTLF